MIDPAHGSDTEILVVDDTPANLTLLNQMLKRNGYKVRLAPSGALALQAAHAAPPDLILLDIGMPGMDGYDVCRALKANPALRDIPILFISALGDSNDKIQAFDAGGVDYITKPFQLAEVHARVGAHLRIGRLQKELERQNRELETANADLRLLHEFRDSLTHMIVHDLRSPLSGVAHVLEILPPPSDPANLPLLSRARAALHQVLEMITGMLDVSRMEAGQMPLHFHEHDLVEVAREAIASVEALLGSRTLQIYAPEPVRLRLDRDLLTRVIQNLIANAIKFTGPDGRIEVRVERKSNEALLFVIDDGCGIPGNQIERIFEKFGQVESGGARVGTGLGLPFCKFAVELHKGRIGVESSPRQGSCFSVYLPITSDSEQR